jgi:hypothetical protein
MKYYKCSFYRNSWGSSFEAQVLMASSAKRAKAVMKEAFPNLTKLTVELMVCQP